VFPKFGLLKLNNDCPFVLGNKFTDSVAEVFAEVFKLNRTIQEIDLSYNEFNEKGALYLGAGLVSLHSTPRSYIQHCMSILTSERFKHLWEGKTGGKFYY